MVVQVIPEPGWILENGVEEGRGVVWGVVQVVAPGERVRDGPRPLDHHLLVLPQPQSLGTRPAFGKCLCSGSTPFIVLNVTPKRVARLL
jgi:hypothetical protein